MSRKVVVFYEVPQNVPSRLPVLNQYEAEVFDYVNNTGATTETNIAVELNLTVITAREALSGLRQKSLVERRNLVTEDNE